MFAIETHDLSKCYGPVTALDRLNLRVPRGSIFGFLGPNGAGKSTTIRILMGLMRPSGGAAKALGMDCWRESVRIRADVGYLPGDLRLYDALSGARTLEFFAGARGGVAPAEIRRLIGRFELDPERRVRQYSKGNKQKLGLILALMHKPQLIVLDEPTTSLDPLVQQTLYDELRAAAARGATVLFSSHTLSEVEALCEHVAIVRAGRLVESERIETLRQRAVRRVAFRLRGPPPGALPPGFTERRTLEGDAGGNAVGLAGAWRGEIQPLLAWLARAEVSDVTIQPPDLEELFLAYYGGEGAAPASTDASVHRTTA